MISQMNDHKMILLEEDINAGKGLREIIEKLNNNTNYRVHKLSKKKRKRKRQAKENLSDIKTKEIHLSHLSTKKK
jgi:hypoxanthine-guanine phosphoribosyltransferase